MDDTHPYTNDLVNDGKIAYEMICLNTILRRDRQPFELEMQASILFEIF